MADWIADLSLAWLLALFTLGALVIAVFGIKMTYIARDLAQSTGLGEAFTGAVFIGAATSLSGIIASGTAAWQGEAAIAVSNSLGGIAAQTLFLVLADMVYRKANLEFAAASAENMMMSAQLMLLLCLLLVGFVVPASDTLPFHPISVVLLLAYLYTVKLLADTHTRPMWLPRMDRGTVKESTHTQSTGQSPLNQLIWGFLGCAFIVAVAGWLLANTGIAMVARTGTSEALMGGVFIAISTSLPELIIAITAVRMGSLTLAVGDIVGGNAFDTLFIAIADFLYLDGPIYTAASPQELIWLATAMSMNAVLLLGLMDRERKGVANIGWESATILIIYLAALLYLLI